MTLSEARAKHGRVRVLVCDVEDDDGQIKQIEIIVRKPNRAEVVRFGSGAMGDGSTKVEALEGLVRCCVVEPDVNALLDDQYGLVFSIGNELAAWSGVGKGVEAKKA